MEGAIKSLAGVVKTGAVRRCDSKNGVTKSAAKKAEKFCLKRPQVFE